jgi:hypothetical protein
MAIQLPKLGPTGKKIATGAAIAGGLTLAAFTISKKAENKRVAGADATYDKKYPLSNNCAELKIFIERAKLELAQLQSQSGGDRGAKRVRERNTAALKSRLVEIEKYYATLDCVNQLAAIEENLPQAEPESKGMGQYLWYGVAAIAAILLFTNLNKKD